MCTKKIENHVKETVNYNLVVYRAYFIKLYGEERKGVTGSVLNTEYASKYIAVAGGYRVSAF